MSNNLQQIITEMQILIGSKTKFLNEIDTTKYLDDEYLKEVLKSNEFNENSEIYEIYPQIITVTNSIIENMVSKSKCVRLKKK